MKKKALKGFTLIEVLVVIGLIAILSTTTIIAMNPGKDFETARNSERTSEIRQILSAVSQDLVNGTNLDSYTDGLGTTFSNTTAPCGILSVSDGWAIHMDSSATPVAAEIDLSTYVTPTYIVEIPEDPHDASPNSGDTFYRMCADTPTRVTIFAPLTEGGGVLSVGL